MAIGDGDSVTRGLAASDVSMPRSAIGAGPETAGAHEATTIATRNGIRHRTAKACAAAAGASSELLRLELLLQALIG